jgi:hypothetical protein
VGRVKRVGRQIAASHVVDMNMVAALDFPSRNADPRTIFGYICTR